MKTKRKKDGYWSEEKTLEELKTYLRNNSILPCVRRLHETGYSSLVNAMVKFGGINKYRKMLGITMLKKYNYWNDAIIVKEIKEIKTKIGKFPTQNDLKNINRCDLLGAICKSGGINRFRKMFGLQENCAPICRDESKILESLEKLIKEKGYLPRYDKLCKMHPKLYSAIMKTGGLRKYRELL